jgi:hypothetical protein
VGQSVSGQYCLSCNSFGQVSCLRRTRSRLNNDGRPNLSGARANELNMASLGSGHASFKHMLGPGCSSCSPHLYDELCLGLLKVGPLLVDHKRQQLVLQALRAAAGV